MMDDCRGMTPQDLFFASLGAVFGWCRCSILHRHEWRLCYWRQSLSPTLQPQVPAVKPLGVWSGYRSHSRGRHWDRRSRYGER